MYTKMVRSLRPFRWVLILSIAISVIVYGLNVNAQRVWAAGGYHYAILAETIAPIDSSIGYNNYWGYLVTVTDSTMNGNSNYVAQVNLPDGAVISAVHVYGIDTDTKNFSAQMWRYNLADTQIYSQVTNLQSSSGTPGKTVFNLSVLSTAVATVDNLNYSYGVFLTLPKATSGSVSVPSLGVLRIVIDWNYAVYLPLTSK